MRLKKIGSKWKIPRECVALDKFGWNVHFSPTHFQL